MVRITNHLSMSATLFSFDIWFTVLSINAWVKKPIVLEVAFRVLSDNWCDSAVTVLCTHPSVAITSHSRPIATPLRRRSSTLTKT